MIVAVARLSLRISYARSLKQKRSALRKIKDKARAKHDVRLAEVDGMDVWQSADLGFALVGANRTLLEAQMEKVIRYIEDIGVAEVVGDDREVLYFGDAAAEEGLE